MAEDMTQAADAIPTNSQRSSMFNNDENYSNGHATPKDQNNDTSETNGADMFKNGSFEVAKHLFDALIRPIPIETFKKHYWERRAVRIKRKCHDFYSTLVSLKTIEKMFKQNHIEFTKDIEIDLKDKDEIISGRALLSTIRTYCRNGCSIRILRPEMFLPQIHSIVARLQEYFQCSIDSNVYLQSGYSKENAARFDDSDTFVFQVHGERHWKVYEPSCRRNLLSNESKNTHPTEEPLIDVVMTAGDLLYYPRGFIYQSSGTADSLYITLRLYRKQNYGELLKLLLPAALEDAIEKDEMLRQHLPIDIWQNMGLVNRKNYGLTRKSIVTQVRKCFASVCRLAQSHIMLDNAVDNMAIRYQQDALPPKLNNYEKMRTVFSSSTSGMNIEWDTPIRLLRTNIVRMVEHDEKNLRLYYSSSNSLKKDESEQTFYKAIDKSFHPTVEKLITSYPKFIPPKDLEEEPKERHLILANTLWQIGILMTEEPLV